MVMGSRTGGKYRPTQLSHFTDTGFFFLPCYFFLFLGPTNSGKTYHAINEFFNASSGIYCGPLRMLATEIFNKSNLKKTPCDLVTGERQICVNEVIFVSDG